MKNSREIKNDLYYTHDHEWVNFRGSVAYVGVCAFKLTGIRQIQQVEFERSRNSKKAGEILAIVLSGEYKIPIHMPVDGEVLSFNEELLGDKLNILLEQPEQTGWVAFIFPSSLQGRNDLLLPEQYLINNKPLF
ncbi:MAG TPA: hypothetical protein VF939_06960 [Puia sp.]